MDDLVSDDVFDELDGSCGDVLRFSCYVHHLDNSRSLAFRSPGFHQGKPTKPVREFLTTKEQSLERKEKRITGCYFAHAVVPW